MHGVSKATVWPVGNDITFIAVKMIADSIQAENPSVKLVK